MDELLYELRDGVGFATLNRPQARNALTFPMYERLRALAGVLVDVVQCLLCDPEGRQLMIFIEIELRKRLVHPQCDRPREEPAVVVDVPGQRG